MTNSYIFTGIGLKLAKYPITNDDILKEIKNNTIKGFDEDRILRKNPSLKNPFDYMVSEKMGFEKRYHVVPFPPTRPKYKNAETTVDLSVASVSEALAKANISGNEIDAWFFSSGTHSQKAPGIGEFVKAYFTDENNVSPVFSIVSACVGFNINLEAAINYFQCHEEAKNIVIAHADTMSELLCEENDFVPFATFGDSSAAVVLTKIETESKVGVINIVNYEDTIMLDNLGANSKGNLYMNPQEVKNRAVPNITNVSNELLSKSNWSIDDLKYFLPHQTGNAIVNNVSENLKISQEKTYQYVQKKCGNLSGASIPACLYYLQNENKIGNNDKLLTAVAGLGGEFGGFTYINCNNSISIKTKNEMEGKTVLITGASGSLGQTIAYNIAKKSANLILLYNSSKDKINTLSEKIKADFSNISITTIQCDFSNNEEIITVGEKIKANYQKINYVVFTHASTGTLSKASKVELSEFTLINQINYRSIKTLLSSISDLIDDAVLITGSVGEEAQFPGSSSYVASKRALRGFAYKFASEIYDKKRVKTIYYLPGLIDSGMVDKLDERQQLEAMSSIEQSKLINVNDIATRMINSLLHIKVADVKISLEHNLIVIRDGFNKIF